MPRPPMESRGGGTMFHQGKDEFREFDLLQMEKETNEMIKLNRIRADYDSKKKEFIISEFKKQPKG